MLEMSCLARVRSAAPPIRNFVEPVMRKPIAMLIVLVFLGIYAAVATTIGGLLIEKSRWIQLLYFAFAGILWVFPLKPLMDWMRAGDKETDPE